MALSTTLLILLFPLAIALAWLVDFVQLHVLHQSRISTYLNDKAQSGSSWALVTGASDGIGFGFVEELAVLGFDVILHGRNKAKLEGLVQKLQPKYPQRQFRILVIDVSKREDWKDALKSFVDEIRNSSINLKVLINNVGGTGGSFNAFDKMSERDPEAITKVIDVNTAFPSMITHSLLPILEANQPSLVINISSITAVLPPPYLGLYSGCKAFNLVWSRSLQSEMKAENLKVEVLGILTGRVLNATTKDKFVASLFNPSARTFAKATLDKVGCGKPSPYGYWPHELQVLPLKLLPSWIADGVLLWATRKEVELEKQGR